MSSWIPDLESCLDTLTFLAGAVLLIALARRWSQISLRHAGVYLTLTCALFMVPLATPATQLPLDYLYQFRPWSEMLEQPVVVQNPLLTDLVLQVLPFRTLVRERLLALEPPLWAHELGTGQPLLGNAQSAPFAPLHLLALVLPPLRALTVAAAWQVLVALLLTHLLLTELGAPVAGRLLGAVAFAFSSFAIAWLYHPLAMVLVWAPGIFAGILQLRRGERRGGVGVAVCGAAALLSGHPETAAQVGVLAAGLWLGCWLRGRRGERGVFFGRSAAAVAVLVALAAPALLPLVETVPLSERAVLLAASPSERPAVAWSAELWSPLLDPFALGSPREGNWRGPVNFNEHATVHAGLLPLVLALAGALALGGRLAWLLAAGAVSLAAAWWIEPMATLLSALPFFANVATARWRQWWIFAVALAAGCGVERVAHEPRARRLALGLLALAALGVALTAPWEETSWQLLWRGIALGSLAAAAATLAIARWRSRFATLAVALTVLDLFMLGLRYHPLSPPGLDLRPPDVVRFLAEAQAAAPEPMRSLALEGRFLAYVPAIYGLWDPRGFDPMRPGAAAQLLRLRLAHPALRGPLLQRPDLDLPMLDYLSVRYALAGAQPLPAPWRAAFAGVGGVVWENPAALPLFFFPRQLKPVAGAEEGLVFARECTDFRREAAVEMAARPPREQSGEVRVVGAPANGFRLEIRSVTGGIVASSVTAMPGWRVAAGTARWVRVNGAFLGLEVPAGEQEVELVYAPALYRWGVSLAFAALAVLGLAGLAARVRRGGGP